MVQLSPLAYDSLLLPSMEVRALSQLPVWLVAL